MTLQKSEAKSKSIPILAIAVAWLTYSQLIALGISFGHLVEFGSLVWGALRDLIPSISRMDSYRYFDDTSAKLHASLMLASMPFLFVAFLATNVEPSVEGVRKKGTEIVVTLSLVLVASIVFLAGFGFKVGRGSLLSFSLLSCLVTGLSAYCYRVAFCIATKK